MIDKTRPHWTESIRDDTLKLLTAPIALKVIDEQKTQRTKRLRKLSLLFLLALLILFGGFPLILSHNAILTAMAEWKFRLVPLEYLLFFLTKLLPLTFVWAIPAIFVLPILWLQSCWQIWRIRRDERQLQEFLKLYRR